VIFGEQLDVVLAGSTNTPGSDYWVQFDEAFMAVCTEMFVLQIEGWEQSRGIQREIDYFQTRGKPVRFPACERCRDGDEDAPKRTTVEN